jgi:hypothetical protein
MGTHSFVLSIEENGLVLGKHARIQGVVIQLHDAFNVIQLDIDLLKIRTQSIQIHKFNIHNEE